MCIVKPKTNLVFVLEAQKKEVNHWRALEQAVPGRLNHRLIDWPYYWVHFVLLDSELVLVLKHNDCTFIEQYSLLK